MFGGPIVLGIATNSGSASDRWDFSTSPGMTAANANGRVASRCYGDWTGCVAQASSLWLEFMHSQKREPPKVAGTSNANVLFSGTGVPACHRRASFPCSRQILRRNHRRSCDARAASHGRRKTPSNERCGSYPACGVAKPGVCSFTNGGASKKRSRVIDGRDAFPLISDTPPRQQSFDAWRRKTAPGAKVPHPALRAGLSRHWERNQRVGEFGSWSGGYSCLSVMPGMMPP
jgi:hypothetical protein